MSEPEESAACFRTVSFQKVVKHVDTVLILIYSFRTVSFQKVVKHRLRNAG